MQLPLFPDPILIRVLDRLIAHYGRIDDGTRPGPTEQLIRSIISSRTADAVSGAAFEKLRARFPRWEMLLTAEIPQVVEPIIEVQDAYARAGHLIAALTRIRQQHGTLDLAFLAGWPVDIAWSWLQSLPGVGPKVAAATLNFSSLGKPILTVDRHLLRVGKRLGLLPPKADFKRGHRLFNELTPPHWTCRDHYQLHWLMKFHSQATCRAGTPKCALCPLTDLCRHYSAQRDEPETSSCPKEKDSSEHNISV